MRVVIDQVWECPRCGTQMGAGQPGKLDPPICQFGHERTEMEQVCPERFGRQFEGDGAA